MGELNLLNGAFTGKVGAVQGEKWKNINTVRVYAPGKDAKTTLQVAQRSKFTELQQIWNSYGNLIQPLLKNKPSGMSPHNYFISLNKDFDPSRNGNWLKVSNKSFNMRFRPAYLRSRTPCEINVKLQATAPASTRTNLATGYVKYITSMSEEVQEATATEANDTIIQQVVVSGSHRVLFFIMFIEATFFAKGYSIPIAYYKYR